MASNIVDNLNDKQKQSVSLGGGINALILAGAGSGKTRVLTHRIHYLVSEKNSPCRQHPCRYLYKQGSKRDERKAYRST